MTRFSGPVLALALFALAAGGCKKKTEGPAAAPVVEPGAPPSAPASSGAAPASEAPAATRSTGVSAATVAADSAYEAWFRKYGLDLNDPKMLTADPDGDGYTNEEEFLAGTDPLDPASHPNFHRLAQPAMQLKEYTKVDLPFVLRSVQGETAQIETTTGSGEKKLETVKAGQTLSHSPYRVAKVQTNLTQDKDGNPVDASHVTLEHSTSHEQVDLKKDLPLRSAASFAVLTSTDGAQTMTVHLGDTFAWPGEPSASYVVKDLRDDQVILEQSGTKQMFTVRKP